MNINKRKSKKQVSYTKVKEMENKILWAINVIVDKLMIVIPKNKKVWIFGAWLGQKYADNSKYFYEYVKNKKGIKAYWITKNKKLYNKLKISDKNVLYYNSFKALYVRMTAGVVFYTNSLYDLGNICFHSRGYLVALWHGVGLKKLYLDGNIYLKKGKLYHIVASLKKFLFWDVKRDLTIICSLNTLQSYKAAFNLKKTANICATGQPRNDIFLKVKDLNSNSLHTKYNANKIILYMPTCRSKNKSLVTYNKLLIKLLKDKDLNKLLKDNNSKILIKSHYLMTKPKYKNNNIIFLSDKEVDDVQKLMLYSDILVTDYSSCFIDFAILNRPIIFLASDIGDYEEDENGFCYNYREITGGLLSTNLKEFNLLLSKILSNTNISVWKSQVKYINNLFNIDTKNISSFSDNVFKEVIKRIK